MNSDPSELPTQWQWEQQTSESLEKHAQWLSEQRKLGSGCEYYFDMAGRLLRYAINDYFLIVPSFYQTVIGLERALRIHYKAENEIYAWSTPGCQEPFSNLLKKAIEDELISDHLFEKSTLEIIGLKKQIHGGIEDPTSRQKPQLGLSYAHQLAERIPKFRNDHFHGSGGFFTLGIIEVALDLRIIADNLKTKGVRSMVF